MGPGARETTRATWTTKTTGSVGGTGDGQNVATFYKGQGKRRRAYPLPPTLNVGAGGGRQKLESPKNQGVRSTSCDAASNIESGGRGQDVAKGLQHFVLLVSIARIQLSKKRLLGAQEL